MDKDEKEKLRKNERERNPMVTFADSINHSMIGDLNALVNGGCLTRFITFVIIVVGLVILAKCSY